jgi:hypothetical protein
VRTTVLPLLVAWALTACGDRPTPKQDGEGTAARQTPTGELTAVGEKGLYRFRIQIDPDPPRLGDYFSVWTIVERAEDGGRAEAGTLEVDATMPEHRHGMTTLPKTRRHDDGRYRTVGCRFHMHGRWVIELGFGLEGNVDRATIEFPFHPPAVR